MPSETYVFYFSVRLGHSNFTYSGRSSNAIFNIYNDKLECITIFKSSKDVDVLANFQDAVGSLENFKGIGLLLDIISFCTELISSNEMQGKIYKSTPNLLRLYRSADFITYVDSLLRERGYTCSYQGDWPVLIRDGETKTFSSERIELSRFLLQELTGYKKIKRVEVSLLNYWRKGLILGELWFWEECYLNFYKIVEHFFGKNSVKEKDIEMIFSKLGVKSDISGIKNTTELLIRLNDIRNNWDIAHVKIKRSQGPKRITNRDVGFNLTYQEDLWGYREGIKELSRFLLCKSIGIGDLVLTEDGGLPILKKMPLC